MSSNSHAGFTSIVVLSYNGLEETTKPCLDSIVKNTPEDSYELIVVDNASVDGTQEYLREFAEGRSNVKLCLNDTNKGYAGGNNDGMKLAQGEYLILLNNDTLVPQGWLNGLLRLFEQNKDIGLIGPVTNSAGNEQRIELEGINADNYESIAGAYTKRQAGVWFTTEKLGFFCVAMRRSLVDKVGYLDEQFGIGMFEDDDYCIRVKKEGYRLAVVEDCFVFHKGSVSFKKLSSDAYAEIFSKNQSYFYKKHDLVWTYSDISLATWARLKSDFTQISDAASPVLDRIQRRLSLMDDSLHQVQQAEMRNISIDGQSMSEKLLVEKHQQLMEISDWASELKRQNEDFVAQIADRDKKLAETHRQLMEMSDWASELKLQNEDFVAQIADRDNKLAGMHLQLMEMSDWASELKQDRDRLHDELKTIKTTFLYRLVAWTKKSQS